MPINTATFPVVQYAVETAAKEIKFPKYNRTLIVVVQGDASASPHFFTGSGMSTGRVGIENGAILVRDYHQGKLTREDLVTESNNRLDSVKLSVLEKGGHYVKKSPPEKKAAIAVAKMCQNVNEVCKMLTRQPPKGENAFRIIRVSRCNPCLSPI